ncbi:MAG: hypothetical protein HRT90_00950, partial [Candidatus Margulisbacteria bacterium]|nr:hypothetical protein [Candidatus Margulisiibacteriota bacterium]
MLTIHFKIISAAEDTDGKMDVDDGMAINPQFNSFGGDPHLSANCFPPSTSSIRGPLADLNLGSAPDQSAIVSNWIAGFPNLSE